MSSLLFQLLVFGVLAGLANVLGGLILFPSKLHHNYKRVLRYLLALGAGFMLAVTFFEILPKTITIWQGLNPPGRKPVCPDGSAARRLPVDPVF